MNNELIDIPRELPENSQAAEKMNQQLTECTENKARGLVQVSAEQQAILNTMPIGACFLENRKVRSANPAFDRLFGYENGETIGLDTAVFYVDSNDYDQFGDYAYNSLAKGEVHTYEVEFKHKDGSTFWCNITGSAVDPEQPQAASIWILQDISERKESEKEKAVLEQQLHHARKMEAIGQLAGGVAHDFNNKLMVIMGNTTLARMDIDDTAKVLGRLEEIYRAAEHSRDITMRLLAFSRRQVINPQALDANRIIAEALKSLSRLIGEHIHITFTPDETLWNALIDPVQLEQIVMNMAVNARDAMPDGGAFVIKTENVSMSKDDCTPGSERVPGDYILISFKDSGFGMDQETLSHMFEPFFTTKEVGKGTGLGLATIYGIISQNSGFIDVASAPGSGTVFKVYLPRHASPSAGVTKGDAAICPGSSTILLVEDEEAVRAVTALFLRKIGYTVYEAESPGKALELVRDSSIPLDLVLTDFIMPEMNGKVLMERIREIRQDIKYMYASGHATDPVLLSEASRSGVDLIQKPYDLKKLSECLAKVIARGGGCSGEDSHH